MKDNWISVNSKLPKLLRITEDWWVSRACLVTDGTAFYMACLNVDNGGAPVWKGFRTFKDITHWQLLEMPYVSFTHKVVHKCGYYAGIFLAITLVSFIATQIYKIL